MQMLGEMKGVIYRSSVTPSRPISIRTARSTWLPLQTDLDYSKQLGLVKKDLTLVRVIDRSLAEAAATQLAPYKK